MRATDLTVRPAGKALGGCSTYRTGILFKQSRPDLSDSRIATEGLAASPLKRWPNMIAGRDMTSRFKPYHRGSKLIDEEPLPSKEHQRCVETDAAFQAQLSAALRSGKEKLASCLAHKTLKNHGRRHPSPSPSSREG